MADRGITPVLNYAMVLGIIALLTAGLVVGMGGFLEMQQAGTAQSSLEVVGNDLAADLEAADRLARANETTTMVLHAQLPGRIADSQYRIEISADELLLRIDHLDVTVRVPYRTELPVAEAQVTGGQLTIEYDPDTTALVVSDG